MRIRLVGSRLLKTGWAREPLELWIATQLGMSQPLQTDRAAEEGSFAKMRIDVDGGEGWVDEGEGWAI